MQNIKLCIVQYTGDLREAVYRLNSGGIETYRAQRYTVDYVHQLASRLHEVTTIIGVTDEVYDEALPGGSRAIGLGGKSADEQQIISTIEALNPDALLLRYPARRVMKWASRHGVRTLVTLANSFNGRSLRSIARRTLFGLSTWPPTIEAVTNHGNNASRQLLQCGVPAKKVLAWDYPQENRPDTLPPKQAADRATDRFDALYVGTLSEDKGVGDLLFAVQHLLQAGRPVSLGIVGADHSGYFAAVAQKAGIKSAVTFLGRIPNGQIIPTMRSAGAVIVPSRHAYPEGLPLTIYEALCSRSALVVTDHPMFLGNVVDGLSGLMVPERDPVRLGEAIWRVKSDNAVYEALSRNAQDAWQALQIETKWHDIVDAWLAGKPAFSKWLSHHSYAASDADR